MNKSYKITIKNTEHFQDTYQKYDHIYLSDYGLTFSSLPESSNKIDNFKWFQKFIELYCDNSFAGMEILGYYDDDC